MRQVKCPQCGLLCVFSPENKFRPFCSERCRLIDLGEWASEGYKIPVQNQSYNELELDQLYNELDGHPDSESNANHQSVAGRKQQE